ncbi:MAG: hypothetical protein ACI9G1_004918 [Pirellulaceae bacterium]|jgi:hypothetical protein
MAKTAVTNGAQSVGGPLYLQYYQAIFKKSPRRFGSFGTHSFILPSESWFHSCKIRCAVLSDYCLTAHFSTLKMLNYEKLRA